MPTFLELDEPVLRRILDFLLSATEVKETGCYAHAYRNSKYHFQPAILRSCKALHALGAETLASNHFILISSTHATWFEQTVVPTVRLWTTGIEGIKNVRMRLHFEEDKPGSAPSRKIVKTGMTCLETFPAFVWFLKAYELGNNTRHSFVIQFKLMSNGNELPRKLQEDILRQLKPFHGSSQECAIRGKVNAELALATEQAINTPVLWYRARNRDYFELICYQAARGNEAYKEGQHDLAIDLYLGTLEIFNGMKPSVTNATAAEDTTLFANYFHTIGAIVINLAGARLLLGHRKKKYQEKKEILSKVKDVVEQMKELFQLGAAEWDAGSVLSMFYAGTATLGLDHAKEAFEHLGGASHLLHSIEDEQIIPEFVAYFTSISKQGPSKRNPVTRPQFAKLIQMVPIVPVIPKLVTEASVSARIDCERYVLRALGYKADLFEDQVVQLEGISVEENDQVPHAFDRGKADQAVEGYRSRIAYDIATLREGTYMHYPLTWPEGVPAPI